MQSSIPSAPIVDYGRFLEQFAAMHHAVSRSVDVPQASNLSDPGTILGQPAQHIIERRRDVADGRRQLLPRTRLTLHGNDPFPAGALYVPTAQKLIVLLADAL